MRGAKEGGEDENRKKEKLIALIKKYPGLDAIALKSKGWRPQVHGSIREAEDMGVIEYKNGGWFVVEFINPEEECVRKNF